MTKRARVRAVGQRRTTARNLEGGGEWGRVIDKHERNDKIKRYLFWCFVTMGLCSRADGISIIDSEGRLSRAPRRQRPPPAGEFNRGFPFGASSVLLGTWAPLLFLPKTRCPAHHNVCRQRAISKFWCPSARRGAATSVGAGSAILGGPWTRRRGDIHFGVKCWRRRSRLRAQCRPGQHRSGYWRVSKSNKCTDRARGRPSEVERTVRVEISRFYDHKSKHVGD